MGGVPSRQREAHARIALPPGASLRLAVVADTHSQPHARAAEHLRARAPDAILHAGDIGDLAVLDQLAQIAPVHAVRGNIDTHASALPDHLIVDIGDEAAPAMRIFVTHIAVYGPKLRPEIAARAHAAGASLVVCGHSHVPLIARDVRRGHDPVVVFNPGSIGPRRFTLPILFGTIDIAPTGVRLAHVDCETGAAWSPP